MHIEAYPVYARHGYPPAPEEPGGASVERNQERIALAKKIQGAATSTGRII